MSKVTRIVILCVLMLAAIGCGQESEKTDMTALQPTIEAARLDPEATVRLFYDLLIQKDYAATEFLVTQEFLDRITKNGQRSYADVQRRHAYTAGDVTDYDILAVRYPDPTTAHVDIDVHSGPGVSEETVFLLKGDQNWQISSGRSRDIVP
jgi:hypothetical protein